MKKTTLPLALLALAMPLQAQVRMDYEKLSQENGKFTSRFVLHNRTGEPLDADWSIYFSQLPMYPQQVSTPQLAFHTVLANYFRLSPTEAWKPLANGDSLVFSATFGGDLCRELRARRDVHRRQGRQARARGVSCEALCRPGADARRGEKLP